MDTAESRIYYRNIPHQLMIVPLLLLKVRAWVVLVQVQMRGWQANLWIVWDAIQSRSVWEKCQAFESFIRALVMLQAVTMDCSVVDVYRTEVKCIKSKRGWMVSCINGVLMVASVQRPCHTLKRIVDGMTRSCIGSFWHPRIYRKRPGVHWVKQKPVKHYV